VKLKQMYRCRDVKYVLDKVLPSLPHGNDGLIFTPIDQPYKAGTDENLFKWKPPYLNSVDFELNMKRGYYILNIYDHGAPVFEDWVSVPEELKNKLISSSEYQLPVIVECVRDPNMNVTLPNTESYNKLDETIRKGGWKIIRLRDDKIRPNEKNTLDKINISINDN
jgi:mRNA guanylyltransferase